MKKILLTLSLFVAGMGAAFSQSTIWKPYDINIDTTWGIRYMSAVDTNTVWGIAYDATNNTNNSNAFVRFTKGGLALRSGKIFADSKTFSMSNIYALDSSVAYVAVYDSAADGTSGRIRKTINGGLTWTTASDTNTMFVGANNFPDFVYFWDQMNGLCLGDPNGQTGPGTTDEFEIWRTHNGGANWTRVPDANIPNPTASEYGLTDSYTTYGKRMWFGTNKGRVYSSLDSGQTWTVGTTTGLAGGVQGLAFRDSLNGLAWGLATTTATQNTVKRTTNGGSTWSAVTLSPTNTGIFDFCVIPGRNSYMSVGINSGSTGYVTSVTPDDGLTWNVLETGTTLPFNMVQVQMLDSAHGWAGSFSDNTLPNGKGGMNKYMGPKIAQACPINISSTKSSICLNDSTTLTALGATTYSWSTSATTSSVTVHPTTNTVYSVTGTAGSCVNTQTISISVTQVTNPVVTVNKFDTICTGGHAVLMAGGATTYSWTPNTYLSSTTGAYVTASPTASTSYTVTGTSGVCKSYNTLTVTVNAGVTPTVSVNSATICPTSTGTVVLTASGTSTSYSWSPSNNLSSTTGTSVSASPTVTTIYVVTGALAGCKSSVTSTVTVSACTGIANVSNTNKISIYPNPSNGVITVNIPTVSQGAVMFITDMIGKEVFKTNVNDNTINLDLTGLQKGLYMLTISNGKNAEVQKLIIQ